MAITKNPARLAAQDRFVSGAPDVFPVRAIEPERSEKGVKKGNKRQITLTITPELLAKVDQVVKRTGQARAAIINMAIFKAIEGDLFRGE